MKFFKLDLLTLLISLFILGSCKNQDSIGLGVNATTQLSGSLIDTSTIIVSTVAEDSVLASNTGRNTGGMAKSPLGYFKDPVFGITEANAAIDLNLPGSAAYTLPTGSVTIDSAVLVLRYANGFYGDSLASRYKVNIYQLKERVLANADYYNTKQWQYDNTSLVGSESFFSRSHDSIYVHVFVAGGKTDSVQKAPPQLRVPISTAFIYNVLFGASATQLASNLVFKNNVKGLYLTMDKTQPGAGGISMMALDSATAISVYYRVTAGSTVDTLSLTMPSTYHAVQVKHTYPAAIQTALANTTKSSTAIYLQGPVGLRTKISFPYLKNILKTVGSDIIINRAELVITPNPSYIVPYAPLPQITMYQSDIALQRTVIQDANTSDPRSQGLAVFGGFYATSLQDYHFIITAYVQDLIRGATLDYGTYLGAVDAVAATSTTVQIAATAQTAARTFAVGTDPTSAYRIKLNIIYTKVAK